MSEIDTLALVIDIGSVVGFIPGDEHWQLAIVSRIFPCPDPVYVISSDIGEEQHLITYPTDRAHLRPAPAELTAQQWSLAQRLMVGLAEQNHQLIRQLQTDNAWARDALHAAQNKITAMRAYAISKHVDGTICRDGLNDFLAAHDLELYQPRHTARVRATFDVMVDGADTDTDAEQLIEDRIEISSTPTRTWTSAGPTAWTSACWNESTTPKPDHPAIGSKPRDLVSQARRFRSRGTARPARRWK
jgi:hypothetical protein